VLAKLDSPYVTKYYDSFVENGGKELCIVMEYAPKVRAGGGRMVCDASPREDDSTTTLFFRFSKR
jgi:NIMA (never in mitosis gene a)-related kinase 1/4/5